MYRPTPISTRTDTLVPYPTLFRSHHREDSPRRPHLRVACACGTPACHRGNDMYRIRLLCVLLACSLAPAAARVVDSSPAGFTVENSRDVPVDAGAAWRALVDDVDRWWPKDHSWWGGRSEEHTSELQSLMRISYAVFCLKKKNTRKI